MKTPIKFKRPTKPKVPIKIYPAKDRIIPVYDGMKLSELVLAVDSVEDRENAFASLEIEYGYYDYHEAKCHFIIKGKPMVNPNYDAEFIKYEKDLKSYENNLALYNKIKKKKLG